MCGRGGGGGGLERRDEGGGGGIGGKLDATPREGRERRLRAKFKPSPQHLSPSTIMI